MAVPTAAAGIPGSALPGPYGVGGTNWDTLVRDHGTETISRIVISAGCSGDYSNGSTAFADNLELDIAGKRHVIEFGS